MSDDSVPTRRTVLGGIASLAFGSAVAGCLSPQDSEEYRLASVEGLNRTSARHDVAVRISIDREVVYEQTHALEPGTEGSTGAFLIDQPVLEESAPYTVEVRLDDGEWKTTVSPGGVDAECLELLYLIESPSSRAGESFSSFVSDCESSK